MDTVLQAIRVQQRHDRFNERLLIVVLDAI